MHHMRLARSTSWLHRFSFFTAIATLLLICSGGMVTSKGVGLAVPDWPTTFGYNMFLFPVSKWVGGILFEHTHRLIASTVGFLTIILAVWLWRVESRRWLRNLGWTALGAVIVQGALGGLRVTMLKDEIGIFHACLAQGFFAMLIVITLATSRLWQRISAEAVPSRAARSLARAAVVTTCVIYAQLALGATMRHQHRDLAILDFPAAYGQLVPDVSAAKLAEINVWRDARALSDVTPFQIWLQMAHRFLALVIAAGVIVCLFRARATELRSTPLARFSGTWFLLLATQITLGAWVIWSNKAADIATAHVAIGATMLAFGVTISALCLRISSIACHPEPRRRRGTSQLQSTPAPSEEASISDMRSLTSFGMTRSTPLMSQTFNPS
jgi:cytochrome c oxidase assembly protein subunit 15